MDNIIHIPVSEFKIDGITNEIGVKTIDGIYLTSSHELTQYINQKLPLFDYKNNRKEKFLFEKFLSAILNHYSLGFVSTDPKDNLDEIFSNLVERHWRINKELEKKLWNKINRNELIVKIFKEKYFIYDPSDWSRNSKDDSILSLYDI